MERLKKERVPLSGPFTRYDEEVLSFRDPDGLEYELVVCPSDTRSGSGSDIVPDRYSIRGIYAGVLSVEGYERTARLLTATLGMRPLREAVNRFRYASGKGEPGDLIDILCIPAGVPGRMGVGAVHHIAWRVRDAAAQLAIREELTRLGYNVTPVIDRKYFLSIYFREPGGILFEVATDPPGFSVDEPANALGTRLMLPAWLEPRRGEIEKTIPPIIVRERLYERI